MHSLLCAKLFVWCAWAAGRGVLGVPSSRRVAHAPVAHAQAACTAALVVVVVTMALLLSGDHVGHTRGSALAAFGAPVVLGALESVVSAPAACRVWPPPPPPSLAAAHDPLMNAAAHEGCALQCAPLWGALYNKGGGVHDGAQVRLGRPPPRRNRQEFL